MLSSMASVLRPERCWHDAILDLTNTSHREDPTIILFHTVDWRLGGLMALMLR